MNCRQLTAQFEFLQIKHIHREHNMVADLLAKDSVNHSEGICTLLMPPALVTEAFLDDILGIPRLRRVCKPIWLSRVFLLLLFLGVCLHCTKKNLCFLLLVCFS